MPDITDPFHSRVADGVLACAHSAGEPVIMGVTGDDPESESEVVGMLLEQGVDRVVAVPSGEAEPWAPAVRAGLTVVFAGALFMALPSVVSSLTGDAVAAITGRG